MLVRGFVFWGKGEGGVAFFFWLTDNCGGGLGIGERGLVLKVANSNNHQATWGVLGAALTALQDYMRSQDAWGTAEFTIFDGKYEVGKGTLK